MFEDFIEWLTGNLSVFNVAMHLSTAIIYASFFIDYEYISRGLTKGIGDFCFKYFIAFMMSWHFVKAVILGAELLR